MSKHTKCSPYEQKTLHNITNLLFHISQPDCITLRNSPVYFSSHSSFKNISTPVKVTIVSGDGNLVAICVLLKKFSSCLDK